MTITAQASGYASGVSTASVGVTLDITATSVTFRNQESAAITILLKSGGNPAVAPPGGFPLTLSSSNPACVTAPSVTVPAGQESTTSTLSYAGNAALSCTSTVTASGPTGTTPDTVTVTVTAVSLRFNASAGDPIRIGAGLEVCQNGNYSVQAYDPATNQVVNVTSATTVTIASSNGTAVLVSPSDTTTAGAASTTVTIPANSNSVLFCVAGASGQAGATSNLTASAAGFGSGTRGGERAAAGGGHQRHCDQPYHAVGGRRVLVLVGIGQPATPTVLNTLQDARKGGGGITATVSVPDTSVVQLKSGAQTGASVTVAIPERNSQNTATLSIDPLAAGTTSVSASIPGGVQSTGGSFPNPQSVTVTGPSLRFNASAGDPIRIGAGLEVCQNGNYSVQAYDPATNQLVNVTSATTVTIASSNGTAVLVSPSDTTTAGAASTTVTIPANSNSVLFCVAGASGQAGATSNLTASATGFGSGTRAVSVLQPVVGISGIATNLTTQSVDDAFNVLVGIGQPATPTVLNTLQDARKGGGGITATVSVPDTSVVQLKSGAQTGASVTVAIPERNSQNTATLSIDPLAAGTTSVSASIPGGVQSTGGSFPNPQSVTVSGTSLRFNASAGDPIRIGAGLEVCQNGNYSVQAYDPATNQVVNVTSATTVTIASSNGTAVLVSPSDTTTVGAASTTVTIPANSNSVLFCVAGASGQAGATSNLTASAGGFGSATPRR